MDIEEYRRKLIELKNWYASHRKGELNEADTRFHLIDRLLFECLGWEKDDCKHEEQQDSEYADYTFYNGSKRMFILEAKRANISFELPVGFDNRTEYKLSSLTRDNLSIEAAVNQVIAYCNKRGVELAAVSNGFQIIAFLAHRNDGIAPFEGKAIVFNSIEIMERNFLFLWQMLSKFGIIEGRLTSYLQNDVLSMLPLKLSAKIDGYPRIGRRNELQTDLQIVSEVILENINNREEVQEEFLKETYCNSGALSQYALLSKSLLSSRYSLLFDEGHEGPSIKEATTKKGLSPDVFGDTLSSRPILLIGDVGAGKSMFINYFIKVAANDIIQKSFTIYVDLGSKGALALDIKEFFLDEVVKIFLQEYKIDFYERNFVRGVYDLELIRFSKGIYADLKEIDPTSYIKEEIKFLQQKIENKVDHLKACLNHISKGWKRQVIIFMDNVDQRNEEVQEQGFLIANEIAAHWSATIFITIRPTTFYKSKKIGALTGYHPKAFTISPPRVNEVILKRLSFALKIARGEIASYTLNSFFVVNLVTLKQFIEILLFSFEQNTEIIEFIDNICNGNIRIAIEYLTTFIGSGHIDTKKILEYDAGNVSEGRRYKISIHEFVRAIIYKEHQYFFPDATEIANVFDISQEGKEHFLIPILLDYLLRYSSVSPDGFNNINTIIEFLQNASFHFNQIDVAFRKCVNKGLIETEARKILKQEDALPRSLRITTIGSYHLQKLINTFVYIDAIIVDVPIIENNAREKISDVQTIHERLLRGIIFCDYMDSQWKLSDFKSVGYDWVSSSSLIRDNIKAIGKRIY